jgi:transposase
MIDKVKQEKQHYSESFKRMVIQEYLNTGVSKKFLLRKYDIKMKSGIQRWMRQLGYENIRPKTGYLPRINTTVSLASEKVKKGNSECKLEARIKELERLLEDEQLRSEAYNRIIDIAEKEHNIPIRKKPNTK